MKIEITKPVKQAEVMLGLLVDRGSSGIGEIVGSTGTGKTTIGRHLVQKFGGRRVCAFKGITRNTLLRAIVQQVKGGEPGNSSRWLEQLAETGQVGDQRPLLVVDEANHLRWDSLEQLRYLADECGWAVLLLGTELYLQSFDNARTKPLLLQLGRRIGAKRVSTKAMDRAETALWVMRPAFGEGLGKELVTRFWQGCRRGNWGWAVELRDSCLRIMATNGVATLTDTVLEAALADMSVQPEPEA